LSRTKVKVATPASNKSSHPACNTSESDISSSVCGDVCTLPRVKSVAGQSTMRTARTSGRNVGIWHGLGSPWLHLFDTRAETNLPRHHLPRHPVPRRHKEASDAERIGSDTNPQSRQRYDPLSTASRWSLARLLHARAEPVLLHNHPRLEMGGCTGSHAT
jgi:hypothetical protein